MEKLILRSVMYGADKIPDSWFERLPGGFYKTKTGVVVKKDSRPPTDRELRDPDRRSHRRRNSDSGMSRGMPPDETRLDDGYRSEGPRRRHDRRGRSRYDGGQDDRDSGEDRRRPQRRGADDRSRRHRIDDDRHGYRDGNARPDDYLNEDRRMSSGRRLPPLSYPYSDVATKADSTTHDSNPANPAMVAGAAMTTGAASNPNNILPSSPPLSASGFTNGYIPYAHLYGASQLTSPPSTPGSSIPNSFGQLNPFQHPHPVALRTYQQNADAQQAPSATAAGAGAIYDGQPGWIYPEDPRWDPRYMTGRDERRRVRDGYDAEEEDSHPPPRSHQHASRTHRSSAIHSSDSRDERLGLNDGRSDDRQPTRSHGGRGKSIREMFDPSQRGLAYSAVGALAGGLVGSEMGGGKVSTGLGAALGAISANAFEARERYVNANGAMAPGANAGQPRGAAPWTLRSSGGELGMIEPPPPPG